MNTPVWDFAQNYVNQDPVRLHMPGHKGVGDLERYDLTEVEDADVLYHPWGIIKESMENAASVFGAAKTVYSAEGASLAIRGMLYLTRLYAVSAGKNPVIAAGRNAHSSFVTAAALLDLEVHWLFGEKLLSCDLTPEQLEEFLRENPVAAVYITSPDYLGNVADIRGLAEVCHRYDVLLLVDNAHGAYLRFFDRHPLQLGADVCCDSAHKTLPVLTGGAYLHIGFNAPELYLQQAERAMALFASTSPSYLILESLDRVNRYLVEEYPQALRDFVPLVDALKAKLQEKGFALAGAEPIKLTIAPKSYGYRGDELAALLKQEKMICEFADPDYLVLMLTPQNSTEDLERLERFLLALPRKKAIAEQPPVIAIPAKAMSMHQAIMQPAQTCPAAQCLGRVLAAPTVSCPPAVPVLVCGEVVDETALALMDYYGITELNII